jgi:hypothetical protein
MKKMIIFCVSWLSLVGLTQALTAENQTNQDASLKFSGKNAIQFRVDTNEKIEIDEGKKSSGTFLIDEISWRFSAPGLHDVDCPMPDKLTPRDNKKVTLTKQGKTFKCTIE